MIDERHRMLIRAVVANVRNCGVILKSAIEQGGGKPVEPFTGGTLCGFGEATGITE